MVVLIDCVKVIQKIKANNPYPEDVFTKPTKEEYIKVRKLFKDAGISQDKFFGSHARTVWNNCIAEFEKIMKDG